jgi:Cu-Zn family superoxide dismutase
MKTTHFILTLIGVSLISVNAFAHEGKAVIKATASDSMVSGEVIVKHEDGQEGVTIDINVANVPPGKHGIHFHENGSCDDMGNAAGSHFNPDKVKHGLLTKDGAKNAHAGDMGNIEVAEDGTASMQIFLPGVNLEEGSYALKGKAIVLHEKEDDFGQPTGNAGGRIGCGIIELVE